MQASSPSRTALVVGGAGGIGRATAQHLRSEGWTVYVTSRSSERAAEAAQAVDALPVTVDPTDRPSLESAARSIIEAEGLLDAIINCAGSLVLKPAHLTKPAELNTAIQANLVTAFNTVAVAGALMRSGGTVTLIASAAARTGLANHEAIAAVKAAIIGLTRSAAATYAGDGLRVNCVAPGLTDTPLTTRITQSDAARAMSEKMHALGRVGSAEDVAAMIAHVVGEHGTWLTGQVFGVDGGLAAVVPARR